MKCVLYNTTLAHLQKKFRAIFGCIWFFQLKNFPFSCSKPLAVGVPPSCSLFVNRRIWAGVRRVFQPIRLQNSSYTVDGYIIITIIGIIFQGERGFDGLEGDTVS